MPTTDQRLTLPPRAVVLAAAVAAVTAVVFSPALENDFVNWDDVAMVVDNPDYRAPGWAAVRYAFTSTWFSHYHPLTWLSFTLDSRLWGLSPAGFHLTNVVLHALSAALAFLLMRRVLALARGGGSMATDVGAVVGALSFALHPLRVEAVAWVTARRDVLCGVFVLVTLLAYLRAVSAAPDDAAAAGRQPHGDVPGDRRSRQWLTIAALFYAAALLSKAIAMTLPILLVILDWYPLRRRAWQEKVPFFVLGAAGAVVAAWAVSSSTGFAGFTAVAAYGMPERVAMAAYSLGFYIWQTALPVGLTPLREVPVQIDPLAPRFLASLVGVFAASVMAFVLRHRLPWLGAGWAAYVVTVLPVSGLAHAGLQLVYDRYSYFPALVLSVVLGGTVAAGVRAWQTARLRSAFAAALAIALLVLLLGWTHLSRRQIHVWRDSETLWKAALSVDPACGVCRSGLGVTLADAGRLEEGERELRLAIALRPSYGQAWLNLGSILFDRGVERARAGRNAEAVRYFTEAAALLPGHPAVAQGLIGARAAASLERVERP